VSKRQAIDKLLSNRKSPDIREYASEESQQPAMSGKKRANFDFDEKLHTDLKTFAAQRGKKMVDVVSAAVKEYMEKHK
jgi:hypothetical protein